MVDGFLQPFGGLRLFNSRPNRGLATCYYNFGRTVAREIMNTDALKMAGVLMISTSTVLIHIRIIPRWMAILGYLLAAIMLLRIEHIDQLGWVSLTVPDFSAMNSPD